MTRGAQGLVLTPSSRALPRDVTRTSQATRWPLMFTLLQPSHLEHHHLPVVCLKGVCPGRGHEALGGTHEFTAEYGKPFQQGQRSAGWFQSCFLGRGSPKTEMSKTCVGKPVQVESDYRFGISKLNSQQRSCPAVG